MGAKTRLALGPEDLLAHVVEGALQVAEGDAAIHHESLDLMELRQMRRIGHIAAVHLARGDHVDGQVPILHDVHLHAGSLGAQQHVGLAAHPRGVAGQVVHVEGVLHGTARMVSRSVQGREVVVVGLDLLAFHHFVAEAQEDIGHLVDDAVDEVAGTHLLGAAGQRHIHGRRPHGRLKLGGIERRLAGGQRLFHVHAGRVHGTAHARALFSGHLAHGSQVPGQRAGLAQHRHAHGLERRRRVRRGDFGQGALTQRRQLLCDCHKVRLSSRANKKEPSSVPPGAACGLPGIQGREKALAVPPRLATLQRPEGNRSAASPACSRSVTGAPGTPTGRLARGRSRSGMLLGRE